MIPKTLVYCNFGNMKMRDNVEIRCMRSWEEHFPKSEWTWVELNEKTFDVNAHKFAKNAYDKRLYSYVSDYARAWYLRTYGGVYVDLDLFMLRPLDDKFLQDKMFIGSAKAPFECKKNTDIISWGIVGCEQNNLFMQELLTRLNAHKDDDLNKDDVTVMEETKNIIRRLEKQPYIDDALISEPLKLDDMTIYPFDVFTCTFWTTGKTSINAASYAIHLYGGSWLDFNLYTLEDRIRAAKVMQNTQHIIIVEGVDRTGKTTLCNMLKDRLNVDIYKRPSDGFDFTRLRCGGVGHETCQLLSHLRKTGQSIIFDRLHLSEYVYGKLNRAYDEDDNINWFNAMECFMRGLDVTLLLVLPHDVDWSSAQHGSDLRPYVEEFERIFEKSKIGKKMTIKYTDYDAQISNIINWICKERVTE